MNEKSNQVSPEKEEKKTNKKKNVKADGKNSAHSHRCPEVNHVVMAERQ